MPEIRDLSCDLITDLYFYTADLYKHMSEAKLNATLINNMLKEKELHINFDYIFSEIKTFGKKVFQIAIEKGCFSREDLAEECEKLAGRAGFSEDEGYDEKYIKSLCSYARLLST